ncbi:MFS general substrate transporter [Athelia psychrophila]|uniref:MFS general substrate transporter n=1 Tax=Athelia psychrophila TaxID=1759441 RepID=A0A166Q4V1_9AGAM|nr:MFS general substrate transporter [Fibularhizoctonia sp. CBS 109695]
MSRSDALQETTVDGLAVRSFEDVKDIVDFRLDKASRPSAEQLDESTGRQLGDLIHGHEHREHPNNGSGDPEKTSKDEIEDPEEPLYVEFDDKDPRDPVHYSYSLKWTITIVGCFFSILAGGAASTYNLGFPSMERDLNCTSFQATVGLAVYALGFATIPLVSTSLSEEAGRRPLYIGSLIGVILMHLMVALSKNIQTVIVARFFAGGFGSTGAIMVGGTIADIWLPHERSLPMAIYSFAAMGGTGLGPIAAGFVEMNPRLQWRWIQWIHMILTGVVLVLVIAFMSETRSTVILTRLARKLRKDTGNHRYRARVEDERGSFRNLLYVSCTRPLFLLFTEPIVFSISIWAGFAWGILYGLIDSVGPVFETLHHFNSGEVGLAFIAIAVGAFLGVMSNLLQDRLYQKNFPTRGPEARLYYACGAGVVFPIGMFIYAWCTFPQVHWIALIIGMVVFIWAAFTIYVAVFTYVADCYGPFASSASAGQSLLRNLMGMAFPLFTQQMFATLTYKWANTVFALIAVLMIPIPFILFFYGPRIRARSKFASQLMKKETLAPTATMVSEDTAV